MSDPSLNDILDVATEAVYQGGRRTLAYFNTPITIDTKSDDTPVTIADRESEAIIRAKIAKHFPTHSIVGEETGSTPGDPNYKWIIDPIDGTKTFIAGVPLYGVLIGVEIKGKPAVGALYMPALDELLIAGAGLGCLWNGRRASVSKTMTLDKALVLTSDARLCDSHGNGYRNLCSKTRIQRTWGDCYGYLLVATGRADIMIDGALNLWDSAAILPIVTESGGQFTTWSNDATIHAPDGVATNGLLHAQTLESLNS